MENAKVILIEDNADHREIARIMLGLHQHPIVAEATTVDESKELISRLYMGKLACDVIVMDGNLEPDSYGCRDAKRILELYHSHALTIPIIGYSASYFRENGIDIPELNDIGKNPAQLLRAIALL